MSAPALPVNLTATLFHPGEQNAVPPASLVLHQPDARCDRLTAAGLQEQGQEAALLHEVYVVTAGHGGIRCGDGSLLEMTAGDLVYIAPGTIRGFEALSPKFSALRLIIPASEPTLNSG